MGNLEVFSLFTKPVKVNLKGEPLLRLFAECKWSDEKAKSLLNLSGIDSSFL